MKFLSLLALIPFTFWNGTAVYAPPDLAAPLRGIYLTSQTAGSPGGEVLSSEFKKIGGNLIVFDVQDSAGKFAYPSNSDTSRELNNRKEQIKDLAATVRALHEQGFYVAARFVLFKNSYIAKMKPAWTLKRKGTKSPFVSRDGPIWLDPGNPELLDYYSEISREIAMSGVDEIQFDYIRFPEGGKGGYVGYSYTGEKELTRDQAITAAVAQLANEIHYFGVNVSVDVFGIVVWDNVSWKVIGQNISELGKYVEAIYPMPYPSHFGPGWGGHRNPADEPYFFVQETTKKFVEETLHTGTKIRPWIQGFAMRATRFGPQYIKDQTQALTDIGIEEFSVWNAANNYKVTFKGLTL